MLECEDNEHFLTNWMSIGELTVHSHDLAWFHLFELLPTFPDLFTDSIRSSVMVEIINQSINQSINQPILSYLYSTKSQQKLSQGTFQIEQV